MNDITNVTVVSDDPYFAEGVAKLLPRHVVTRISAPLFRTESVNADCPERRMVVLCVKNAAQETFIAKNIARTDVPVLVVSDRQTDPDAVLKNKNIYIADRYTRATGLRQMVVALLAKREVERIHLSLNPGHAGKSRQQTCELNVHARRPEQVSN